MKNKMTKKPLYQIVKEGLIEYMKEKKLERGAFFLSEREVCKKYGVSPITARRAVHELTNEGVLIRRQGIGTFVGNHLFYEQVTIGLILFADASIFGERDYYISELIRGVSDAAKSNNIKFKILNISEDHDLVSLYEQEKNLWGFIVVAPPVNLTNMLLKLQLTDIPFIVVNARFPKETGIAYIDSDNRNGAYDAVKYLIQNGHKNILFVNDDLVNSNSFDRMEGVKKAFLEFKIPFSDANLIYRSSKLNVGMEEFAYQELRNRFRKKNHITAIFFGGFSFLLGGIRALNKIDMKVPEDISIMSFDDFPELMLFSPPLSTVYQPIAGIGRLAVRKLIRKINNRQILIRSTVLKCKLIIRESCKTI